MADIGNAYIRDSSNNYIPFTGDVIDVRTYLLAPGNNTGSIGIDYNQNFTLTRKNIVVSSLPSSNVNGIYIRMDKAGSWLLYILIGRNGNLILAGQAGSTEIIYDNTNVYPLNTSFDLQIDFNHSSYTLNFNYKLSSSNTWTTLASAYYAGGFINNGYIAVGGQSSVVESPISGTEIINNGTILFSRDPVIPPIPIPKIGSNDISKIYLGSEEIGKIYLGSEIVYEA